MTTVDVNHAKIVLTYCPLWKCFAFLLHFKGVKPHEEGNAVPKKEL